MNRREFLQTGTACGLLLLKPSTAFSYQANSAVRLGLLGCGNRGTTVATSFSNNTTAQVVALADIFPDKLAARPRPFRPAQRQPRPRSPSTASCSSTARMPSSNWPHPRMST